MMEVSWSDWQLAVIDRFDGMNLEEIFRQIPEDYRRYKCRTCHHVVDATPCPSCGSVDEITPMCPLDHTHCSHDITPGIAYCPLCNDPVCPSCGSHDVAVQSRITGYLGELAGWNAGKKQELLDRQRYSI